MLPIVLFPRPYTVEVSKLRQQLDEAHLAWSIEWKRLSSASACRGAYSITSSARARSVGGIVTPIAFALLRLITNWKTVGC